MQDGIEDAMLFECRRISRTVMSPTLRCGTLRRKKRTRLSNEMGKEWGRGGVNCN